MNLIKRLFKKLWPIQGKGNKISGIPISKFLYTVLGCMNFKVVGNFNTIICKSKSVGKTKFYIKGDNNKVVIEKGVRMNAGTIWIENRNNVLSIGSNTTIEEAHLSIAEDNLSLIIGEDCMLSRDIRISTTDSHSIIDIITGERINKGASVIVGKHVWIGYHSCINKGVTINDNSVIASNSLVTHDIPSEVIVAGVPAKVKKTNISWDRKRL